MILLGRHNVFPQGAARVFTPRWTASSNWWEVAGKTCIAAYQAKGAASYAASKVNLADSGTYDLSDGAAYPTWDTSTGWTGNGTDQYLDAGSIPIEESWTLIGRFANITNQGKPFGVYDNAGNFVDIHPNFTTFTVHAYRLGIDQNAPAGLVTTGVMAIAGSSCYLDGSADGTFAAPGAFTINRPLSILAQTYPTWSGLPSPYITNFLAGDVLAVAIWSDTLTSGEIATVSTAIAAL